MFFFTKPLVTLLGRTTFYGEGRRDPGFEATIGVRTALRTLIKIWRGDLDWAQAARAGALTVDGSGEMHRLLPRLFLLPGGRWARAPAPA